MIIDQHIRHMDCINRNDRFRLPAEWEPQSGIQLTWPHAGTDWLPYLPEITATLIEMARAIAQYEPVVAVIPPEGDIESQLRSALGPDLQERLRCYPCATDDTWARDHGPLTLVSDAGADSAQRTCRLLDFRFNGWGGKFPADKDNLISRQLHAAGAFRGILEDHGDFVLEGGAIESDGAGTVFTTSTCLLAPHRNQPMTQAEIERRLLETLHARRIVWLDHGQLIGDDTDGHIDTIVRPAPDDTLLYVGCDDRNDPQYADLMALEQQLQSLRTLDGRPYRLLRLPMPDAICDRTPDGEERLPATYANFVILNGAVLCPTYAQPEKDAVAAGLIQQAFPGRLVIGIDARTVIRQHGSLHCLTMQYPEGALTLGRNA
ncbi:MAG: agmatine deiminase family protein [Prevotella sp.]|nr:agmatine deiminase family protein [Prevotella sp.]MDY4040108.1 agmatine deiminase family protein [Prevotella sp.]